MNTLEHELKRIDENFFAGELNKAFIWAMLEVRSILCEQDLNRNEVGLKLAKAIEARYPQVGTNGKYLLTALAMISVS